MEKQYEIVNKRTQEVTPIETLTFLDRFVEVTTNTSSGLIGMRFPFTRDENGVADISPEGDYFSIREVGTQIAPNQDAIVSDEGAEVPVKPDMVADIEAGKVNADDVADGKVDENGNAVVVTNDTANDTATDTTNPDNFQG